MCSHIPKEQSVLSRKRRDGKGAEEEKKEEKERENGGRESRTCFAKE